MYSSGPGSISRTAKTTRSPARPKSLARRDVVVVAGEDGKDSHEIGLHAEISAMFTEFTKYKYTFQASTTLAGMNRIGFILGTEKGSITIQNATPSKSQKS